MCAVRDKYLLQKSVNIQNLKAIHQTWVFIFFKNIIEDINITFFAKHSGSISGMTRHLINGH